MRKLLVTLTLVAMAGFVSAQTINDQNAEKRSVSGYHGVSISGSIELFLTQGGEESVAVSADDPNLMGKIITEVKDGILHIYLERKSKIQIDWKPGKRIRAYVSVKDIDYLSSSGSGKVHIAGNLRSDKLHVDVSGSGDIEGGVMVKDFSLGISGSANADLSGSADNAEFHISGSGNIRNYDFNIGYCNASISGSGNVRVTVSKELSAHISGSGNVFIKGQGTIKDYSASGSGKFKRVTDK